MNLQKNYKVYIIFIVLFLVFGYFLKKELFKSNKTIEESQIQFSGNSELVLKELAKNQNFWNGKIIEIYGTITSKTNEGLIMDNAIFCQWKDSSYLHIEKNEKIKIKGFVVGYDELLNELKLKQCIVKQN